MMPSVLYKDCYVLCRADSSLKTLSTIGVSLDHVFRLTVFHTEQ